MKPKTMILLIVAVGCGLGASIMTSRLLADRGKPDEGEQTVPVLVAKARVAAFQPIKEPEKLFEVKQFPVSVAPKRPVGDFEEIKDQRLTKGLAEGAMVLKDDILNKDDTTVDVRLLPGQRAVSIRVTAESVVAGFVLPGSRVDVVGTFKGAESSSRLILQNMLVMAVDDKDRRVQEQKSFIGQTVTLAATPEEAGRLALAQSMGELRLLLKAHGDNSRISNFEVKFADLAKPPRDPSKPAPEPEPTKIDGPATVKTGGILPPLDEEPAKPVVKAEEPKPAPTPVKKKRHVMRIIHPTSTEKVIFNDERDDDEDGTPAGASGGKPAATPAPEKKLGPPPAEPKPEEKAGRVGRTRAGK
jgi:pilus assembly protein CpaB